MLSTIIILIIFVFQNRSLKECLIRLRGTELNVTISEFRLGLTKGLNNGRNNFIFVSWFSHLIRTLSLPEATYKIQKCIPFIHPWHSHSESSITTEWRTEWFLQSSGKPVIQVIQVKWAVGQIMCFVDLANWSWK